MRIEIGLLGGFSVAVDGREIPAAAWRRRHAAALVKLLALRPGHRLLRDQVIDALWPDLLVHEAAPRLHKAAHFARRTTNVAEAVVLNGDVVALFPAAEVTVDVDRFDAAVEAYRSGGEPARAGDAVQHYRGDLLPDDLFEPWTELERDRRRKLYLGLLKDLGRWDDVVVTDPLDEEAHLRLTRGHIERGDRRAALHQLDLMQQVWRRELEDEPGEAAQELRDEALALPVLPAYDSGREPLVARRMTGMPHPATPTIGRERDTRRVLDVLDESRVVTLLGIGGVGKTRLAAEVAHRYADVTSQQICYVDLTKVRGAELVPELVTRELGIHVGSSAHAEQTLEEALRRESMLLVLDNFEHVIDAAWIVAKIVTWAPNVKILVTSRARLRVAGERIVDVAPLSVEQWSGSPESADAVALFAQAATAVDPHFHLERSLDDVIAICRAVDGLPLAIELAAGHLRTLPPVILRHRLGTRLGSPVGASRDAHPRQQTIPATIDWSLQLLGPDEQRLFARLGVFNGPADLTAVEQVCGDPDHDVVNLLSHLVDQSLVRRVTGSWQEPRFVLLELVRARARELLEPEYDVIADRHAEHVVAFVEDVDERRWSDLADRWIDLIAESLSEIRAAHARAAARQDLSLCARIAAALGTYWHLEGHHVEGRRWISAVLEQERALDPHISGRIHIAAGFLEWPRSQYASRSHWQRAIELMRVAEDPKYLAHALALVSVTYLGDGDEYAGAMELNDKAVELARRVGERPLLVQVLNVRGELTRVGGEDDRALAAYSEALELADAVGDKAYVSALLANLSYLANHRGDYDEAWRLVREALRICWSLGRRMMAAWTVSELAGPELGCGRPERAAILIGAADEAMRALGAARHPGDMPEYELVLAGLKQTLGESAFSRLASQGSQLSLKEAVELALSDDATEAMASI